MTEIDPIKFGEMSANIENIKDTQEVMQTNFDATATRIENTITSGFNEQKETNKDHDKRIRWNTKKLYWLIGILIGGGILSGAKLFLGG